MDHRWDSANRVGDRRGDFRLVSSSILRKATAFRIVRRHDPILPAVMSSPGSFLVNRPSDDLIAFMNGFLLDLPERTEPRCIMIGSDTKRIVAGEEVVNERLRQLAAKDGVTVIILPAPTARDPDSELRKFAEQFKQQISSKPGEEKPPKR